MQTADGVPTARSRPGHGQATPPAGGHGRWRFLRHYLEMVAAMLVGMVVLGAAVRGVLALAGLTFPAQVPELAALEMAFDMSVGMVAWMRLRGHGWASTLEMAGAMLAPAVALLPLLWLGVISGDALLVVQHLAMLPLMYLVMLRRRGEYGGAAHG
jgi:hypothetical protein